MNFTPEDIKKLKGGNGYTPQKLGFDNRRPFNLGLHSQNGDVSQEKESSSPFKQTSEESKKTTKAYWYKINGKTTTKAAYNAYKNKPGGDEPGKQTNDPDASGNKAKIAKDRANIKKTPLDFSSPLKGKKRRARRALREAKYGTKSRRKARKIEGTTRREQKKLENLDTRVAKKREAKSMKRYKGFTSAEIGARREQGPSYKTDSEKSAIVTKEKELRARVANRSGLNYNKTPLDFKFGKNNKEKTSTGTWKGLGKTNTVKPVIKKSTGINKKIVDAVTNTIIPKSGAEALTMIAGGGVVKNLKNIGSKLYQGAKTMKNTNLLRG
jgi:hypothetical protein